MAENTEKDTGEQTAPETPAGEGQQEGSSQSNLEELDTAELAAAFEKLKAEADEYKDKFMRTAADLENFRRRADKEKSDLIAYGMEKFFTELLPVLDSFDKAFEGTSQEDASEEGFKSFCEGITMVRKQLLDALGRYGLQTVEAQGKAFDPNLHQAIQRVEKDDVEDEMIDQEFQKGYQLNGRLIRPSMVTVAVPKS